jgi:hypothetical protein
MINSDDQAGRIGDKVSYEKNLLFVVLDIKEDEPTGAAKSLRSLSLYNRFLSIEEMLILSKIIKRKLRRKI